MIIVLIMLLALLIINLNINDNSTDNVTDMFFKELVSATRARYATEYIKLRSVEESERVFLEHLRLIAPVQGMMNPFNSREFKSGILTAIYQSDKSLGAELCFIHDLMIEEYHKLVPSTKLNYQVGINEFYNNIRTHL